MRTATSLPNSGFASRWRSSKLSPVGRQVVQQFLDPIGAMAFDHDRCDLADPIRTCANSSCSAPSMSHFSKSMRDMSDWRMMSSIVRTGTASTPAAGDSTIVTANSPPEVSSATSRRPPADARGNDLPVRQGLDVRPQCADVARLGLDAHDVGTGKLSFEPPRRQARVGAEIDDRSHRTDDVPRDSVHRCSPR